MADNSNGLPDPQEPWCDSEANGEFDLLDDRFSSETDGWNLNEDHDHWLSDSQMRDLYQPIDGTSAPGVKDWKDVVPNEETGVHVTFDKAKRLLWDQAKKEIQHAKEKMDSLSIESVEDIFEYLVGPDSEVIRLLAKELHLSHETAMKFLATFVAAASLSLPHLLE